MKEQRRRVGVIVAPQYFDTTCRELQELAPSIDVLHTQLRLPRSFDYDLEEFAETAGEIEECAIALADAGSEVVIQLATPFSSVHGWHGGNALQQSIADRIGVPFEMMGLSVPSAVHALGANRVAVASIYYPVEWTRRYSAFLEGAGLDLVGSQDFFEQGRIDDREAAWSKSFIGFDTTMTIESIIEVGERFPDAEAIVVPGIPGKFIRHVPAAEAAIGRPIVSYFALWWKCLTHLDISSSQPAGALLGLLNKGQNHDIRQRETL